MYRTKYDRGSKHYLSASLQGGGNSSQEHGWEGVQGYHRKRCKRVMPAISVRANAPGFLFEGIFKLEVLLNPKERTSYTRLHYGIHPDESLHKMIANRIAKPCRYLITSIRQPPTDTENLKFIDVY